MKKVLVLAAMFLGTTAMVNAQTEPAKAAAAPKKEVKAAKKADKKVEKKADAKMEAAKPAEAAKAKK